MLKLHLCCQKTVLGGICPALETVTLRLVQVRLRSIYSTRDMVENCLLNFVCGAANFGKIWTACTRMKFSSQNEQRITWWGRDFSRPSRPVLGSTRPLVQCVPRVFPGIRRPRRGLDHPPESSAEVEERVELYLYDPSELLWPILL
jgi:hypothetical protein